MKFILLFLLSFSAYAEVTVSVGQTSIPKTFEHARFAFPDLAQGGPGCCSETSSQDSRVPAFKVAVSEKRGNFGVEGSFAYLGTHSVSFDVSGPFGGSVQGPGYGRCVESGQFRIMSLAVAGTYSYRVSGVELVPKLGLAGNWLNVKTQSHCDIQTSFDVSQDYDKFSMSPVVGLGVKYPLTKKYAISFEIEGRRVLFSDNEEAKSYGQGNPLVLSMFFGVSF